MRASPAWQFSIRTLLIGVAGVALLMALGNWIGALWTSLTVWTLLLVVAHVGGLLIARRRAPNGSAFEQPRGDQVARGAPVPQWAVKDPSQLAHSRPLSGWVRQSTIGGVILGALGGLGSMWLLRALNVHGLILGALSAGVLGGFFAFLTASFLAIAANAFGEAKSDEAEGSGKQRR